MISERETTAVHEAGHAVANFVLRYGPEWVSIIPTQEARGECFASESKIHMQDTILSGRLPEAIQRRAEAELALTLLAGPAAARAATGQSWREVYARARGDFDKALTWMPRLNDGRSRLDRATAAADWFVSYTSSAIERVARALLADRELEQDDVRRSIGPGGAASAEFVSNQVLLMHWT